MGSGGGGGFVGSGSAGRGIVGAGNVVCGSVGGRVGVTSIYASVVKIGSVGVVVALVMFFILKWVVVILVLLCSNCRWP